MRFEQQLIIELPFMVNLPDGPYQIDQAGFTIEVLQNRFAVPVRTDDGRPDYRIGSTEELANAFGAALAEMFRLPLHTLLRRVTTADAQDAQIVVPTDRDLAEQWATNIIPSRSSTKVGEE